MLTDAIYPQACHADNCGTCKFCLDMLKFGGAGILRQPCLRRRCQNKSNASSGAVAPPPIAPVEPDVYDEHLIDRRVRALRVVGAEAAGSSAPGGWHVGSVVEWQAPMTRHGLPRFTIRFDDGYEAEVTMPDNPDCLLLPKGAAESSADPLAGLSILDQRKAYKAAAAAAEAEARAAVKAENLKLWPSALTEAGFRCVSTAKLSRLGVVAYDVKTNHAGEFVNLGRFRSKTQAAVAFSRYMAAAGSLPSAGGPSRRAGGYGNMVIPFEMLDAMDDGVQNTIEKVLDVRTVEVEVVEPVAVEEQAAEQLEGDEHHLPNAIHKRTKASVAARAAGCAIGATSSLPLRTKQSAAAAAAGMLTGDTQTMFEDGVNAAGPSANAGPSSAVFSVRGMCTAGSCPNMATSRHPRLPVALCAIHANSIHQLLSTGWPKGEDDEEDACRWCCGLSLDALDRPVTAVDCSTVLCDACGKAWCSECIGSNLGVAAWKAIESLPEDQEWHCFYCDPSLLQKLVGGAADPNAVVAPSPSQAAACSASSSSTAASASSPTAAAVAAAASTAADSSPTAATAAVSSSSAAAASAPTAASAAAATFSSAAATSAPAAASSVLEGGGGDGTGGSRLSLSGDAEEAPRRTALQTEYLVRRRSDTCICIYIGSTRLPRFCSVWTTRARGPLRAPPSDNGNRRLASAAPWSSLQWRWETATRARGPLRASPTSDENLYIYVYIYISIYIYISVYLYIYISVYLYLYIYISIYL